MEQNTFRIWSAKRSATNQTRYKSIGRFGNQIAFRRSIGYQTQQNRVSMGVIINQEGSRIWISIWTTSLKEVGKTSNGRSGMGFESIA